VGRIETGEIKFLRLVARHTLYEHKIKNGVRKE
jgi:hypothetical protein